jgi:hypothetical protein
MTFIILTIVIIAFVIGGISKIITGESNVPNSRYSKSLQKKDSALNQQIKIPTIAELIGPIETLEQVKEFEKQMMEIYCTPSHGNKNFEKLQDRCEAAMYRMWDKVIYYQYLPDDNISLTTPLSELKNEIEYGYKYFTPTEYKKLRKKINNDWFEIDGGILKEATSIDETLEKKSSFYTDISTLNALVKYREIVESRIEFDEKINSILNLLKYEDSFRRLFFISESEVELKKECIINYLEAFDIPPPCDLIGKGYDNPVKLKSLTDKQLKQEKGFGPKTIALFKEKIKTLK